MNAAPVHPPNLSDDPQSPERQALDRVLKSDVLHRAPNLVLFLRYVCEMQLAGKTDAIKEYNIAVEALGRGSDFDQKKDSIVRVEAHRLRKRLAEYYETVGASDPIEIVLPAGSYVPLFHSRISEHVPPPAEAVLSPVLDKPLPPLPSRKPVRRWPAIVGFGALAAAVILGGWMVSSRAPSTARARTFAPPPVEFVPSSTVRIAAGTARDGFADGTGATWQKDRFFVGGQVVTATPRGIRRTTEDSLYMTRREGQFEYRIPVTPGSYELRLHFAETVFGEDNVAGGGESSRVFQVQVNGGPAWTADIISEADGPNTAYVRVYRNVQPQADGLIHVAFRPALKEAAFVNGIEVVPSADGRALPVRLVARATPLVTPEGEPWSADQYSQGGSTVQRHEEIQGSEPSMVYQAERFGNFSYAIPVASDTRYTLTLRFAETWFGEGRPGAGGIGSRVFDVYCNGQALLRNFDVLREAGGPMRQVKKVFRDLDPNAQGKLDLQFVPIRNYAMVNAIEVTDSGR